MIYIETPKDLRRLEQAAQDGRFHVTWFLPYVFRDVSITGNPVSSCNIHLTHNAAFTSAVSTYADFWPMYAQVGEFR